LGGTSRTCQKHIEDLTGCANVIILDRATPRTGRLCRELRIRDTGWKDCLASGEGLIIIIIITFTREGPAGFHQPRQIAPARAYDFW
jgi:hypothetical protein